MSEIEFLRIMNSTVLIIDDEEKLRNLLSRIVKSEGFEVVEASDCKTGLKRIEQNNIDVVLCDVKLPDGNGVDLTHQIKLKSPSSEVILLTAFGNISDGVQAMKNGAFDYLVKGDDNNKIIPLLHRAVEKTQLQNRVKELEKRVSEKFSFESISCKSKSMQQAVELAKKVAPNNTTVLLTGETGTGKEVFAQAIHHASSREGKSFVALNCSNFNKEVLESELFGHKQGAFTGALKDKKGLLEEANGGTLFLDEIGEMPFELQSKLLRVLETNEFIKLGDTRTVSVNFRLIAATNKDLKKECEKQQFRSDLLYRINTFTIFLPPLRERKKDIEPIASFFANLYTEKMNKKNMILNSVYLEKLESYPWPGNVRELKNIIERSVILTENEEITIDSLPLEILNVTVSDSKTMSAFELSSIEKLHIQKVMNYTNGNKTEAAKLLNIAITTLYRKLEEYKIYETIS